MLINEYLIFNALPSSDLKRPATFNVLESGNPNTICSKYHLRKGLLNKELVAASSEKANIVVVDLAELYELYAWQNHLLKFYMPLEDSTFEEQLSIFSKMNIEALLGSIGKCTALAILNPKKLKSILADSINRNLTDIVTKVYF